MTSERKWSKGSGKTLATECCHDNYLAYYNVLFLLALIFFHDGYNIMLTVTSPHRAGKLISIQPDFIGNMCWIVVGFIPVLSHCRHSFPKIHTRVTTGLNISLLASLYPGFWMFQNTSIWILYTKSIFARVQIALLTL